MSLKVYKNDILTALVALYLVLLTVQLSEVVCLLKGLFIKFLLYGFSINGVVLFDNFCAHPSSTQTQVNSYRFAMSVGEYGVYPEENLLPAWTQPSPGIVQPLRKRRKTSMACHESQVPFMVVYDKLGYQSGACSLTGNRCYYDGRLPSPPRPASSSLAPDPDLVCLFCSEMFQHPDEHKQFLQHLLLDHDFVIGRGVNIDGKEQLGSGRGSYNIQLFASLFMFHPLDNVKLIANLPAYIRYWRNKFRVTSPSQHCTTMRARAAVGEGRQEERQFLFLSDSTSSEDRELRAKLQVIVCAQARRHKAAWGEEGPIIEYEYCRRSGWSSCWRSRRRNDTASSFSAVASSADRSLAAAARH